MSQHPSRRALVAGTLMAAGAAQAQTLPEVLSRPGGIVVPPGTGQPGAALTDATLTAPYPGAAPVFIRDLLSIHLPVRKFGALGDGSDQTARLNRMFEAARQDGKIPLFERGSYGVRPGGVGSDGTPYCLLNQGNSMRGVGAGNNAVVIFPLEGTPAGTDILRVEAAGTGEFLEFSDLVIAPDGAVGGPRRGGVGFRLVGRPGVHAALFKMSRIYVTPGNDHSAVMQNLPAADNQQGQPSNALFAECYFGGGFRGMALGDSNLWLKCVFRSNAPERAALDIAATNHNPNRPGGIANLASVQHVLDCNFGGLGACIAVRNGRHIVIENANAELGNEAGSTGSPNGALIDIAGDVGTIVDVTIKGGQLAIFGDSTARSLIRLGNVQGVEIGGGVTLAAGRRTGPLDRGVEITPGASDVVLGRFGINDPSAFKALVEDAGTGTCGLVKPLALASGHLNVGSGFEPASVLKDGSGRVHLSGEVVPPAGAAAGGVIFTLPLGFRPASHQNFGVRAAADRRNELAVVQILQTGQAIYQGPERGISQYTLSGIAFTAAEGARYTERPQPS